MVRYLETFFRHWVLLLAPLLIAVSASVGIALTHPRMYQASARVWFDSSTIVGNTSWNPYTAPADAQAASLKELLQTRNFARQVGQRGPLAEYLSHSSQAYTDPISKALGALIGGQGSGGTSDQVLTDRVFDALNQGTVVAPVGPQILTVTFSAPDAAVASGTAQAIVDEFFDETLATRRAQAQASVDFYQKQLQLLPAVSRADTVGQQRQDDLIQKFDDAQLQLAADEQPSASGFRLVDRAEMPDRPVGIRKALLLAGMAGTAIGLALMTLVLLLLTWSDRTLRRPEELRAIVDHPAAGVIPRAS